MIVPDTVRKCVVFVGYKMADDSMRLAGSGFFLGRAPTADPTSQEVFLVTARHVIMKIRSRGLTEVYIRANTTDGQLIWIACPISDWHFHPTDNSDVAAIHAGMPRGIDHLVLARSICSTPDVMAQHEIGLGDEVFVVGLFRHHSGTKKNIPIIRTGNIAAFNEEQIATSELGPIDAYLIEARSIGGLSGSPVFVNLGIMRYVEQQVKHSTVGPVLYLLGLIHGHYDARTTSVDNSTDKDDLSPERVNTGIALVTPMHKILETIDAIALE